MDATLAMGNLALKRDTQNADESNSQTSSDDPSSTTCNHNTTDSTSSDNSSSTTCKHNTIDSDSYEVLDLGRVEALYSSICKKIKDQESVHPDRFSRPIVTRVTPVPETTVVDTPELVADMLRIMDAHINLKTASPHNPALSIDSEGPLSLVQVMIFEPHLAFFIDCPKLGSLAFSTSISTAQCELTLKTFFEADKVLKLLWDCRGDSGKIQEPTGVSLNCVYDVQLMDLATRNPEEGTSLAEILYEVTKGDYQYALRTLVEIGDPLEQGPKIKMLKDENGKETGMGVPEKKREFPDPYLIRPISKLRWMYAVNDVRFLPAMCDHFVNSRYWSDEWASRVWKVTGERLKQELDGTHDAPAGWDRLPHVDKTANN